MLNSRREEDYYFYSPHAIFLRHEIKDGGYNDTNIKQAFARPKYDFFFWHYVLMFFFYCVYAV